MRLSGAKWGSAGLSGAKQREGRGEREGGRKKKRERALSWWLPGVGRVG